MKFLEDFIKGIIIGIGAVAPGVSGGAFAVMLGVYTRLTDAIANIFHDLRRKIITLFPLGLGMGVGLLLFSKIMKYLFENYEFYVTFLFVGLMLGTLSSVFKEANKRGWNKKYLIPCILTLSVAYMFVLFEEKLILDIIPEGEPGLLANIIYGGVIGFGTIIPGISSSFILMYLGVYEFLLDAIVQFDLMVIIPVGVGGLISVLVFAKFINFMFKEYYGYTYYAVIGFVIGSIISILPEISFSLNTMVGLGIGAVGYLISFGLSKIHKS